MVAETGRALSVQKRALTGAGAQPGQVQPTVFSVNNLITISTEDLTVPPTDRIMTTISSGPAQEVPTLQRTSGLSDSEWGARHLGAGRGGEEEPGDQGSGGEGGEAGGGTGGAS